MMYCCKKPLEIKWIDNLKCKVSRNNLLKRNYWSLSRSTHSNLIKIFVLFSDYTLLTTNSMLRQNFFVEEETGVGIDDEQVAA